VLTETALFIKRSLSVTAPPLFRASKSMSNLDITIKRLPQDGKIKFRRSTEMKLNCVWRQFPPRVGGRCGHAYFSQRRNKPLEDMALSPRNYNELTNIISKPYVDFMRWSYRFCKQLHYMRLCTTLTGRTENMDGRRPCRNYSIRFASSAGTLKDRF